MGKWCDWSLVWAASIGLSLPLVEHIDYISVGVRQELSCWTDLWFGQEWWCLRWQHSGRSRTAAGVRANIRGSTLQLDMRLSLIFSYEDFGLTRWWNIHKSPWLIIKWTLQWLRERATETTSVNVYASNSVPQDHVCLEILQSVLPPMSPGYEGMMKKWLLHNLWQPSLNLLCASTFGLFGWIGASEQ